MADDNKLPAKDDATFKQALKNYDSQQYKKAIKLCDQILKNFPNHGESLSMKGLSIYQNIDQQIKDNQSANVAVSDEVQMQREKDKAEAMELVKMGLRCNVRSHICWHVFGIVQRGEGKYKESAKAFAAALRIEPENTQMLREAAVLQIHTRDFSSHVKTRQQLLNLQSNNKHNWLGFLIGHYLEKNFKVCLAICDSYMATLLSGNGVDEDSVASYERSEILLFKARVLFESHEFQACFDFLQNEENTKLIKDINGMKELMAYISLRYLNLLNLAKDFYLFLIKRNPENIAYHSGYILSVLALNGLSLDSNDISEYASFNNDKYEINVKFDELTNITGIAEIRNFYLEKLEMFPKIWIYQVLCLSLLSSDDPRFKEIATSIIRRNLVKGVPTLFDFFSAIYNGRNADMKIKKNIIASVVNDLKDSFLETKEFTPDFMIWLRFFLCQHTYMLEGAASSLKMIDPLIEDCPTVLQFHLLKCKILLEDGQTLNAAYYLNEARKLDLQDRYMNTKSVEYLLKSYLITSFATIEITKDENIAKKLDLYSQLRKDRMFGDDIVGLFSKHEGDLRSNLDEMQCIWYAREAAFAFGDIFWLHFAKFNSDDSYETKLDYLESFTAHLKHSQQVVTYFNTYVDDQFDFHQYVLRKGTVNAYLNFLTYEDIIKGDPKFIDGARSLLQACMLVTNYPDKFKLSAELADERKVQQGKCDDSVEKKKLKDEMLDFKSKAKNEATRFKPKALPFSSAVESKKKKKRRIQNEDKDPKGMDAFLKLKANLEEKAKEVAEELMKTCNRDPMALLAVSEYLMYTRQPLLAVKYLRKARSLAKNEAAVDAKLVILIALLRGEKLKKIEPFVSYDPISGKDTKIVELAIEEAHQALGVSFDDTKNTAALLETITSSSCVSSTLDIESWIELTVAKLLIGHWTKEVAMSESCNVAQKLESPTKLIQIVRFALKLDLPATLKAALVQLMDKWPKVSYLAFALNALT